MGFRWNYINEDDHSSIVSLVVGGLAHGFQFVDEKLSTLQESEIYQKRSNRFIRQKYFNAERLKNYNELEKGDYVYFTEVHGIGQYLGIETIEISVVHCDYVSIQYQMEIASRFLSIRFRKYLSKYVASDGKNAKN